MRHLILIFGDQLDRDSTVLDGFDPERDSIWMAENHEEATYVRSHKLRLAFFFSAMRHFRDELVEGGKTVHYHALGRRPSDDRGSSFAEILARDLERFSPERLVAVAPGDRRVCDAIERVAADSDVAIEWRADQHFYTTPEDFAGFSNGRKTLVLEAWYRRLRKRFNILIDESGEPAGGDWNYDADNREEFGREGPRDLPRPMRFTPDAVTEEVVALVETRFGDHPGRSDTFDLPVTPGEARRMLAHFVRTALPRFGTYQDALWCEEPFLYHSRLSAAMNVKLLHPRECVDAAIDAWRIGEAPLNSVEGFVRQILGWREYVRGIYETRMPEYAELNALDHRRELPTFYWTGETDLECVRAAMKNVIDHGYAHHIQRLMVLGLLAQLHGVHPYKFHEWHVEMYVDAIDWVSLPNTLGMSQFGDGGIVGSKPYCASGNYIHKMSNHCR
ncbi:MAG: cryptochrome/photolyase family protein, partial [Planctomycetota bacterium]